ncbi:MAG: hypothetical protein QXU60_04340, partial [Sulfolobales archaeon]
VFLGELINDGSRYPYMAVAGGSGIPIAGFFNFYMEVPEPVVFVILGFLIFSIAVFMIAAYLALYKRFVAVRIES